jgi:hypothetical protein
MATNMLPTIEKLEVRKNYSTWKTQMRYYLSHEELWDLTSIRQDNAANKRSDYFDYNNFITTTCAKYSKHPETPLLILSFRVCSPLPLSLSEF